MSDVQTQSIEPKKPSSSANWKQLLFSFDGRVGRKQYWSYTLWVFIAVMVSVLVLVPLISLNDGHIVKAMVTLFLIALGIAILWSSLAIQVKRFHDVNKSGWFLLLSFIPYIGSLIVMIWLGFFKGTEGENRFGRPYNT